MITKNSAGVLALPKRSRKEVDPFTLDEANRIIRDIARENGVQVVAKSKSMVSEETELNHVLIDDGVEVVETDLGEWIGARATAGRMAPRGFPRDNRFT